MHSISKLSKMAQPQNFNDLPTEALFSFFCSLEPSLLGTYNTVCKKWFQMSEDNELWRQYCIERWDKNPKESDCAKNWLIPVREGGGTKENRIDWKKCYFIRSLYDRATKFFQLFPEKKPRLEFLKKKGGKKSNQGKYNLFSKGWPSAEDLSTFEKRVRTAITEIIMTENHDELFLNYMPDYTLLYLFTELELSVLRRINISRVKYLGITKQFLKFFPAMPRLYPDEVPSRLAEFAAKFAEIALDNDVPMDIVIELVTMIANVFIDMAGNVVLPPEFDYHLTKFVCLIIAVSTKLIQSSLKHWANEQEHDFSTSPTHEFEKMWQCLSCAFAKRTDTSGTPILFSAIQTACRTETKEQILTMLSAVSGFALGCGHYIADHIKTLMTSVVLPYWKPVQDPEYLVGILHYFSLLLSSTEAIQIQYVTDIIPPLLEIAKSDNQRVQQKVAFFVLAYCENLDNPETLVPYLADLLEVMYSYFNSTSMDVRVEAVTAVSSLIITCITSFSKYKDRMMTEFKKLLANGNASDRKVVIEVLARIGAAVKEQDSSISSDIEVLYDQIVEDCKQDREAHLDTLLKMTQFAIMTLGPKFSKYLDFVVPLVLENTRILVVEEQMEDIEPMEEEDEDVPKMKKDNIVASACEKKTSALGAIEEIIAHFDRNSFLAIHEEIGEALRHIISHFGLNVIAHFRTACETYSEYIQKLFEKGDSEWCTTERMTQYWTAISSLFVDCVERTESIQAKYHSVYNLTKIYQHLCEVSTPSQPLLTEQFMRHFTEQVFDNLWVKYYQDEAEGIPFDSIEAYGAKVIDLMEAVCVTRKDKDLFWKFADPVLDKIGGVIASGTNQDEYRWYDACLIGTVFEHFGNEMTEGDRLNISRLMFVCMQIRTPEMFQCLANHLGVMARKYPIHLPKDENIAHLCSYLVDLLIGEDCQRESKPEAYDNALMALSSILVYVYSLYESSTGESRGFFGGLISTYFAALASTLPPAVNGDKDEALICIDQFCQLLKKPQIYFEDEDGPELKDCVIEALQKTLEMPDYDTPEVHNMVDPALEALRAQQQN